LIVTNHPNGIRAVLYDFDGTLADSTDLIMRCYRHTMAEHLGQCPPDEEWLAGFGTPLETQIATYRSHQDTIHDELLRPFPGAAETVAELARRGIGLAIVTSKHRRSTLRGMGLCGITGHFGVIITPEDVSNAKPHPEPVLAALEKLGVAADEALFVGDSPHDMASGRAAGTRTAAALWGPFPRESLLAERPDVLLHRQEDVLELVGGA
jgi:pyrophosphatase PpaX